MKILNFTPGEEVNHVPQGSNPESIQWVFQNKSKVLGYDQNTYFLKYANFGMLLASCWNFIGMLFPSDCYVKIT